MKEACRAWFTYISRPNREKEMGQRLTITIKSSEKKLASCYWHWSGYTKPAIKLLDKVFSAIKLTDTTTEEMVNVFVQAGASFNGSRNNGLIAATEKEIERQEEWGEYHIVIDIMNEIIDFNVLREYDEEAQEIPPSETIIKTNLNPREISFSSFVEFYNIVSIVGMMGYLLETPSITYERIW